MRAGACDIGLNSMVLDYVYLLQVDRESSAHDCERRWTTPLMKLECTSASLLDGVPSSWP
jgi:hypothetical protein